MASAVDEVSSLLGIPQAAPKNDTDELKSPEQHQVKPKFHSYLNVKINDCNI